MNSRVALVLALLLAGPGMGRGGDAPGFVPSQAFRTIHFVEFGEGPIREYVAPDFEKIEVLHESASRRVLVSTALPPTTATRTEVLGLFLLVKTESGWILADARRFEAIGKDGGAHVEAANSERAEPRVRVTLFQGGRQHSYSQCATYRVGKKSFQIDLPRETRIRGEKEEASGTPSP